MGGLLKEIYRVLKPGGVVRTAVPDLDHFIAHYDAKNADQFVSDVFQTEAHGAKNRHWWMYNGHSSPPALGARVSGREGLRLSRGRVRRISISSTTGPTIRCMSRRSSRSNSAASTQATR